LKSLLALGVLLEPLLRSEQGLLPVEWPVWRRLQA
jgi:hypothetical protein